MVEFQSMKKLKLKPPSKLPKGDALALMLKRQRVINSAFYDPKFLSMPLREGYIKEYCLANIAESVELLDQINWKLWKKTRKPVDKKELIFEAIDALHFVLSIFDVLELDRNKVLAYYLAKAELNVARQKGGY